MQAAFHYVREQTTEREREREREGGLKDASKKVEAFGDLTNCHSRTITVTSYNDVIEGTPQANQLLFRFVFVFAALQFDLYLQLSSFHRNHVNNG